MNFLTNFLAARALGWLVNHIDALPGLIDRALQKAAEIRSAALVAASGFPAGSTQQTFYSGKAAAVGEWRDLLLELRPRVAKLVDTSARFLRS